MKACVLLRPGSMEIRDLEIPEPGPGEALVRVHVALTCGTDLKTYRRGHPQIPLPSLLGHEFSGEIVRTGPGVEGFSAGDAVMGVHTAPCGGCYYCRRGQGQLCESLMDRKVLGAFAEYVRLPSEIVRSNLYRKPAEIGFDAAAFLEPLSCVVHGIRSLNGPFPETALVIGAGPIGLLHVMVLAHRGCRVQVAGRNRQRLERARSLGASAVWEPGKVSDLGAAVRSGTGGRGVDAVFECTGSSTVWRDSLHFVRKGGVIVLFGGLAEGETVNWDATRIHYDEITLKGVFHYTPDDVREARSLIVSDRFPVEGLITDRLPLAEVEQALVRLDRGDGIKFAILPGPEAGYAGRK